MNNPRPKGLHIKKRLLGFLISVITAVPTTSHAALNFQILPFAADRDGKASLGAALGLGTFKKEGLIRVEFITADLLLTYSTPLLDEAVQLAFSSGAYVRVAHSVYLGPRAGFNIGPYDVAKRSALAFGAASFRYIDPDHAMNYEFSLGLAGAGGAAYSKFALGWSFL